MTCTCGSFATLPPRPINLATRPPGPKRRRLASFDPSYRCKRAVARRASPCLGRAQIRHGSVQRGAGRLRVRCPDQRVPEQQDLGQNLHNPHAERRVAPPSQRRHDRGHEYVRRGAQRAFAPASPPRGSLAAGRVRCRLPQNLLCSCAPWLSPVRGGGGFLILVFEFLVSGGYRTALANHCGRTGRHPRRWQAHTHPTPTT